ncbi:TspO/MBR family protein [Devosia sp.]|uniref:TspO/MBR family protein n=1 Tax=Devosia sp. TaxID=1871048 RepID=UPI003BAC35F6
MSTIASPDYRSPRALFLLAAFVIVVFAVGGLIGVSSAPGEWYATLNKPPFNPPNWVFGPVWSVLYIMIAVAGWRTYMVEPRGHAMLIWVGQMVLNWLWSPTWFTLHLLWPAFVVIAAILALIVLFIANRWYRDRVSALLFVPYAAWVGFANLLNLSIAILN